MCGNDGVTYRNLCELQEVQFPFSFLPTKPLFWLFPQKNSDPHPLQATCRAGVQLAHSGKCTDLSAKPSCPTSCPEEGKVVPTAFHLFKPRHKRWCAAVTETATPASVNCGDGRAVKGWRWQTTRTARPQSKLKKPTKNLSNVDPSPDTHPDLHCTALHWFLFGCFCCRKMQRQM